MSNNIDKKQEDKLRKKRERARRRKKNFRNFLIFLGLIIIALAAFLITVKVAKPDFDFSTLIPQQAVSFVNETIFGKTTTTTEAPESTTQTITTTTTARHYADYMEFEEFAFDVSKQGNNLGNLLGKNSGKVSTDMTFIYHIVDGKGIYRFNPSTEDYTRIYSTKDNLTSLNLRGEFLYFVNSKDNCLYKLRKSAKEPEKIVSDARFAYIYDSTLYYLTTDNRVCFMQLSGSEPKTVYQGDLDCELNFVGISLSKIFCTVKDEYNEVKYLVIDMKSDEEPEYFREKTSDNEIVNMQLENGFFYYFEKNDNDKYDLIRKKFGSDKTVKLAENVDANDYAIVDRNKVYYSEFKGSTFSMKEINMNSENKKVLLSVKNVKQNNTLIIQHGGEYDFIIGRKSEEGSRVYRASCMYTSSTNVMNFKDGQWKY